MTLKEFTDELNIADLSKFVQFMRNRHRYGTPLTAMFQREPLTQQTNAYHEVLTTPLQRKSSSRNPEFFIAQMLPERLIVIKRAKLCDEGKELITLDESVTYDIDAALDFVEALK